MRDASQIAFFRAEMTVKFDVEWGPARAPPRTRRIPASRANTSKHARLLGTQADLPHVACTTGKLLKFSLRKN